MTLAEMRQKRQEHLDAAQAIVDEHDSLDDEQRKTFDAHMEAAETLAQDIARREALEAAQAAAAEPVNEPAPQPDPGRAAEPPANQAAVPRVTSRAANVISFRNTVPVRLADGSVRQMQPEERAHAFGTWINAIRGDADARSWCLTNGWECRRRATDEETRVMKEGTGGGGGYLVPEPLAADIIINVEDYGVARKIARVWPMTRDTQTVPRLDSEVTTYWVGEAASITASDPTLDQVNLVARKLAALTRISEELMDDAVVDMGDLVAGSMGRAMAKAEDDAAFIGDGTSTYGGIMGLKGEFDANESLTGVVTASSGDDTFPEVLLVDLAKLVGQCPEYALSSASWLCSQVARGNVFERLAGAGGGTSHATIVNGITSAFMGYPIQLSASMPAGATTDYSDAMMLAFGDFRRGLTFGDRKSISIKVLEERYADTDEIGIRGIERLDINFHGYGTTSAAGPVLCLMGD